MDIKKQRQRRRDDVRLAESGNARSDQLLMMPTESLTGQQTEFGLSIDTIHSGVYSIYGLSGSERRRLGWLLDMKYQTCFQ